MYETFLMFLLGYGLVQYPRHLWMQSNLDYYLLRTQMRASSDFKAIGESQLNISLVVADVMKTKAEVRDTHTHTPHARTHTYIHPRIHMTSSLIMNIKDKFRSVLFLSPPYFFTENMNLCAQASH